jgi:uncharacterized membrane protein YdbT with pleckstrin-like domain
MPLPPPAAAEPPSRNSEQVVWSGRPSQFVNTGTFITCAIFAWLIVPIPVAFWRWLEVRCITYQLTNERLRIEQGVLSRRTDELELYRVKDTAIIEPFWLRLVSLATVQIIAHDISSQRTSIHAIPAAEAKQLRETIRTNVERLRTQKRVREIDFA